MQERIFVYDPTGRDTQSRVRGIGRYMQLLRETFEGEFTFTDTPFLPQGESASVFVNPFFNVLAPPLLPGRIADKQIAVIHDLIPLKYRTHFPIGLRGKWNVFLNRNSLRHYDLVITDSQASKRDIVQLLGLAESKIRVVYPSLPPSFPGKAVPASTPSEYFLYVGDATWNKNLVNIARAVKTGNTACICVGKVFEHTEGLDHPWQKELKEFHELARNDARFVFPGFLSNEKLASLYAGARANLLVSRDEGFGFSYVEASAFGCPSILADRPIFHEIAQDAALFSDPENPEQIAANMGKLSDPAFRKGLGFKALQRSKYFNSTAFRESFLAAAASTI